MFHFLLRASSCNEKIITRFDKEGTKTICGLHHFSDIRSALLLNFPFSVLLGSYFFFNSNQKI
ncbi:MAG: hypothetical protein LBC89_03660, partial [Bacteroidales bacterium]|nr:hypothetical protein [Bacteroidales bacterium]